MAGIYHPSRGGVRGGKDQFNWDDVKGDKERENYLGMLLCWLNLNTIQVFLYATLIILI